MTEIERRGRSTEPDLERGDQITDQGLGLDQAPKGRLKYVSYPLFANSHVLWGFIILEALAGRCWVFFPFLLDYIEDFLDAY